MKSEFQVPVSEQDEKWPAPKLFALGIVTLVIALSIIVACAYMSSGK